MKYLVLCPGSRSGPLALAAGGLVESYDLKLITSIDERSAAFLALGISTATGRATAVVTTSGSAVGNLLPAAIEADRSCQPLIFLTADRPERLKNCGANQTVNQEEFLKPVCRWVEQCSPQGFHLCSLPDLEELVNRVWTSSHEFPGPVHCNIPFEEPLHPSLFEQKAIWNNWQPKASTKNNFSVNHQELDISKTLFDDYYLEPFRAGIIIAGAWRGSSRNLNAFKEAVRNWQLITSWPIFADPLSGLEDDQPGLIYHWELLINSGISIPDLGLNVLRLGPLPASRVLENWLIELGDNQVLITEGDSRYLDPLGLSNQFSIGMVNWWQKFLDLKFSSIQKISRESTCFLEELKNKDRLVDIWLEDQFQIDEQISEPALARWVPKLMPSNLSTMIASSSPIRDWITFGGPSSFSSRCFGFRGVSGIDGTLSLAMGLSIAVGPMILITGDLALLHDSNGWLFSHPSPPPLIILLIDNGGGGIFNQLDLDEFFRGSFEKLFAMPQSVDPLNLASAHKIPYRQISSLRDLGEALEWGSSLKSTVLLRVCTCPNKDNNLRNYLQDGIKYHLHRII